MQQGNTEFDPGTFTFINQTEKLGWPPHDWDVPGLPKLWQYNLHYFDWLWGLSYDKAREAVIDWMARYPLIRGRVGWDSYPTSLRLSNWCGVFFDKFRDRTEQDTSFLNTIWRGIFIQVGWLARHPEIHLQGNHLFENGAALAFTGSCFSGDAAQKWLQGGLQILNSQIPEQILPDGMHFERSPMYHSRMIWLMRLLRDTGNGKLMNLVEKPYTVMQETLAMLLHPDGDIALLNDSAFNIYNTPRELVGSDRMIIGAWSLPDAGYYGYRGRDGSYVVCDAGNIGPDYIPGHAHADIFSFELSMNGHRVIVDSGLFDYERSRTRSYCRSTRAHNTVEIEGMDQSEMWGGFRVARRGYPHDVKWNGADDGFMLSGWHDGYTRLKGKPVHARRFQWSHGSGLVLHDTITTARDVMCRSYLHLHPECSCETSDNNAVLISFSAGRFKIRFDGPGALEVRQGSYYPEFSIAYDNTVLAYSWLAVTSGTTITCRIEPVS